jgi:hypothetical protein
VELPVIGTNLGHQVMLHPPPAKRLYEDETQRLAGRLDAPPTVVNDHDPVVLGDTIGKAGTNVERMANELSQARARFHHALSAAHLDSSSASPAFLGSYATEILTGSHGNVVIPQEQTAILKGNLEMGSRSKVYTERQAQTDAMLSSHQIAGQKAALTRKANIEKFREALSGNFPPNETLKVAEPQVPAAIDRSQSMPTPLQAHRQGGVVRRAFHL